MKNVIELNNDIIKAIYTAKVVAKECAGMHHNVVLKSDGTVYDGFGMVWDKHNDTELYCAYRDPRGIEENDRGLDKDYDILFAKHSWYKNGVMCISDEKNTFKFLVTENKIEAIDEEE